MFRTLKKSNRPGSDRNTQIQPKYPNPTEIPGSDRNTRIQPKYPDPTEIPEPGPATLSAPPAASNLAPGFDNFFQTGITSLQSMVVPGVADPGGDVPDPGGYVSDPGGDFPDPVGDAQIPNGDVPEPDGAVPD